MSLKVLKNSTDRDFEIFYNALSIGWHLGKIAQINPAILDKQKKKFDVWIKRHFDIMYDGK